MRTKVEWHYFPGCAMCYRVLDIVAEVILHYALQNNELLNNGGLILLREREKNLKFKRDLNNDIHREEK